MSQSTTRYEEKFPTLVDSSMMAAFKRCPRLFYESHILGLRPSSKSVHLHAGAAYADAQDAFRKSYYQNAPDDLEEAYYQGFIALTKSYGDFELEDESTYKDYPHMILAFFYYYEMWPPLHDFLHPMIIDGKAASEFSFSIPFFNRVHPDTGDPLLYGGKLDALMLMNNAICCGYDDKTTKTMGPTWADQWDLRSQFTGYIWGANEYGYNLSNFVVRGISIQKTQFKHAQAIVSRPRWRIERWAQNTAHHMDRMAMYWKVGYWPAVEDDACSSFGGCPMKSICMAQQPDQWRETEYVVERWTPVKDEG